MPTRGDSGAQTGIAYEFRWRSGSAFEQCSSTAHTADEFAPAFLTATVVESVSASMDGSALVGSWSDSLLSLLRAGVMMGLRVGDVDLTAGHVRVRQTLQEIAGEWAVGSPKSKRSNRDVPLMHSGLIAELRKYKMFNPRSGDPAALF